MSKKVIVNYGWYGAMIEGLAKTLKGLEIDCIVAIPKGGLPIGVHLAHYLEKPLITSIRPKQFIRNTFRLAKYNNILLVDDLTDTGKTMEEYVHSISNKYIITATLYHKPYSVFKPNVYMEETEKWIVFPWERVDEIPNREGYEDAT